ncbi:DUF4232 domain-containing protein [Streptomyces sp. NPDC054796]
MARPHARSAPAALAVVAALTVSPALAGCGAGTVSPADGARSPSAPSSAASSSAAASVPGSGSGEDSTSAPAGSAAGSPPGQAVPKSDGEGADGARGGGAPAWCATSALTPSVRALEAGAGNRYAALVVTNTSGAPCRTQGWPGLQFTRADGDAIPTTTVRDRSRPATQLTLQPGERAWSRLHWTVVPGEGDPDDGSCPTPATLRVIPPDQREADSAKWKLGSVCGTGHVEERALRAGDGPAR